jgi:hypothetical protein
MKQPIYRIATVKPTDGTRARPETPARRPFSGTDPVTLLQLRAHHSDMIRDARVLRAGFVPREVEHRDAEVNHLSSVL